MHNLIEDGERAVSVHVYSLPFDSCEIYQPEGRAATYDVPLGTRRDTASLCPGEQAEAAPIPTATYRLPSMLPPT